jgi:hypothetical protein
MLTGGCLCGAVRYRIDGEARGLTACHCSMCRRWTGHGFASVTVARGALTVEGEVGWYESTPGEVRRGFCPVCGSSLFWDRIGAPETDVLAGTLDLPTGLRLQHHIYVADKGDYYEIADGLPQYPATRP